MLDGVQENESLLNKEPKTNGAGGSLETMEDKEKRIERTKNSENDFGKVIKEEESGKSIGEEEEKREREMGFIQGNEKIQEQFRKLEEKLKRKKEKVANMKKTIENLKNSKGKEEESQGIQVNKEGNTHESQRKEKEETNEAYIGLLRSKIEQLQKHISSLNLKIYKYDTEFFPSNLTPLDSVIAQFVPRFPG